MSLHYLVKNNMCETVHNHSNASIKCHDKLTLMEKHITNVQSVCLPLALTRALRQFCHWLTAWSGMLCCIPDHAKIVSSGTFAECLCMMRPTDLCEMPVSLAIWRVVLCVPGAPSWLSAKSLTVSMFSAVCDVWGVPLPSSQFLRWFRLRKCHPFCGNSLIIFLVLWFFSTCKLCIKIQSSLLLSMMNLRR